MSYQVGGACYATTVEAGAAACAAYAPVSTLVEDGAVIRTVSCLSADTSSGSLNLQVSSTPISGGASSTSTVQQQIAFPECRQQDYVVAGEVVFAAILAAWVGCWGLWKITTFLNWSRGDA